MSGSTSLDSKLDDLYAGPPDEFVSKRDELAKELRKAGDKDAAAEVKALRRPTAAAALVNELSRERKKDVAELAKAGEDLRSATSAGDGKKLRAAAKREREAVGRLMEAAEELGSEAGGATSATLDRIAETLRAATRDSEVGELVASGRLDRERSAATLGDGPIESSPPKKGGGKDGEGKGGGKKKSDDDAEALKRAKAELEKTEGEAAKSEKREAGARAVVEEAEHALAKARDVLKERRAETKQAGSEVSKAKRKVASAKKKAG